MIFGQFCRGPDHMLSPKVLATRWGSLGYLAPHAPAWPFETLQFWVMTLEMLILFLQMIGLCRLKSSNLETAEVVISLKVISHLCSSHHARVASMAPSESSPQCPPIEGGGRGMGFGVRWTQIQIPILTLAACETGMRDLNSFNLCVLFCKIEIRIVVTT